MKKLAVCLLFLIPALSFSQSGYLPGFIVQKNGDTLHGSVAATEAKNLSHTISFMGTGGSATEHSTSDIRAFGYNGGNTFESIGYTDVYDNVTDTVFMKKVSTGYYSLYSFWKKDLLFFVMKDAADSVYFLSDDIRTASGYIKDNGNYRNELMFLSRSCGDLKAAAERVAYTEADVSRYVLKLNQCVAPGSQGAVVFKTDPVKLNLVAYAGGITLGSTGYEYTGRFGGRLSKPSLDKNLSLNFGVHYIVHEETSDLTFDIYSNFYKDHIIEQSISIPLTLQYYLTKGVIKPYIDAGVSVVHSKIYGKHDFYGRTSSKSETGLAFMGAAGIDGFITKNLFVRAEYRYELYSHYPTIGIGFKF